ncbi:MAG: extracellular solute-binding protein [Candidatus Binatota bacterium]
MVRTKQVYHVGIGVIALFFFLSLPRALQAQSAHQTRLIEGAKKEGKLVWYTSMAIDTSKPLLDAFLKEYPFIKAELLRLGEEQLTNRIMNETRAGKWAFDVMASSAISVLVDRHILAPYLSPERDAFVKDFKDPQGYWTGIFVNNLILAYNTKFVAPKDAPKDYPDLLDPKWKGRILMDSTDYDWFGTLITVWGREKAIPYMERLARQQPMWRRGHGLTAQLLGAGETPLAWAYNFRIERMKKDGAPVEWVDSFNPIMVTINGIGLSARPANPDAAKLFIDFAISKRGQEMIREMRRIPARSDVKPLALKMDQSKLKLRPVPKEVYLHLEQYAQEFRKIFGL